MPRPDRDPFIEGLRANFDSAAYRAFEHEMLALRGITRSVNRPLLVIPAPRWLRRWRQRRLPRTP